MKNHDFLGVFSPRRAPGGPWGAPGGPGGPLFLSGRLWGGLGEAWGRFGGLGAGSGAVNRVGSDLKRGQATPSYVGMDLVKMVKNHDFFGVFSPRRAPGGPWGAPGSPDVGMDLVKIVKNHTFFNGFC